MGDREQAQALRKRSENITEDDVWRHKAHVFRRGRVLRLISQSLLAIGDAIAFDSVRSNEL
jgi:hypothetical protein